MSATPPFRVAIPARYNSSRLPGKPLRHLAGRPIIERVYRQGVASGADEVIIATDDERIRRAALEFGADVCMTAPDHQTGTDRLAEVAQQRGWADADIVVNLQGDEPLMPPVLLRQVASGLAAHPTAGIATLYTPITEINDVLDPNIVKVVLDKQGYALYFSRAPIPYQREQFAVAPTTLPAHTDYFRHIGIYAYRAAVLRNYPTLDNSMAEQAEALEQLRALWHGIRIHAQKASQCPPLGIDTPHDLVRVEAEL